MMRRYDFQRLLPVCAWLATGLAACSTTPDAETVQASAPAPLAGLAAQQLAPGECGLFGWDASPFRAFVFFATEEKALYHDGSQTMTLSPSGPFPAEDYGPVQLDLGPEEPVNDSLRYASARITQKLDDGFTRVQPVAILQMCQPVGAAS
ncbi:hypothetical protein [uncultured Algimonas sp.]|uniref:hypothetical protein n=1 Tax=uncultured Algimonas sp. TaxID=1547920 RepID=UPI00262825CD|nr:hypothetical protein [uncultured Algimonas sp.]